MSKLEKCPVCNTNLGKRLGKERRLYQYCKDEYCGWIGEEYIPEILFVKTKKIVAVSQFYGWHYEVYDKYGRIMIYSKSYQYFEEAEKDILRDIKHGREKDNPCTGVLYQPTIEVEGKVYV